MTNLNLNLESRLKKATLEWRDVEKKQVFHLENGKNVFCYIDNGVLVPFAEYNFYDDIYFGDKIIQNKVSKESLYFVLEKLMNLKDVDRIQVRGYNKDLPVRYITKDMLNNTRVIDEFKPNKHNTGYNSSESFYL